MKILSSRLSDFPWLDSVVWLARRSAPWPGSADLQRRNVLHGAVWERPLQRLRGAGLPRRLQVGASLPVCRNPPKLPSHLHVIVEINWLSSVSLKKYSNYFAGFSYFIYFFELRFVPFLIFIPNILPTMDLQALELPLKNFALFTRSLHIFTLCLFHIT